MYAIKFRSFSFDWMVICLSLNCPLYMRAQNMVGPGEVDEELEAETAEECSKYGKVLKCLIFEVSVIIGKVLSCFFHSFLHRHYIGLAGL